MEHNNFENRAHKKTIIDLRKQQARIQKELMTLKLRNQKVAFLVKTLIMLLVVIPLCLGATLTTATHFHSLMQPPDHCQAALFDASNLFQPLCGLCQAPWLLQQGICTKPG